MRVYSSAGSRPASIHLRLFIFACLSSLGLRRAALFRPVPALENALAIEALTETFLELPIKVDSISRAPAPPGAEGVWHSYVISQGMNTITGMRAGTHAEVTTLLQDMIERLNDRRAGRKRPRSAG